MKFAIVNDGHKTKESFKTLSQCSANKNWRIFSHYVVFVIFAKNGADMPTIFIVFGFIFKFYSDDHEPIHVHVIKDGNEAKYNVDPVLLQVFNHGFKKNEISMIVNRSK